MPMADWELARQDALRGAQYRGWCGWLPLTAPRDPVACFKKGKGNRSTNSEYDRQLADQPLPIIRAGACYLSPMRLGDRLRVELRAAELRRRLSALDHRFIGADGATWSEARTVHCLAEETEAERPIAWVPSRGTQAPRTAAKPSRISRKIGAVTATTANKRAARYSQTTTPIRITRPPKSRTQRTCAWIGASRPTRTVNSLPSLIQSW